MVTHGGKICSDMERAMESEREREITYIYIYTHFALHMIHIIHRLVISSFFQPGTPQATVSAAEDSSCNWAVILGTLLAIGALVSLFVVIFSAFVTLWLWPILGVLLLVGHGLLLFAVAGSQTTLATPAKLSAAALCLEVLCYVFLVPTYLFRSFIVTLVVVECFSDPVRTASIDLAMGDHSPVPVWHNRGEVLGRGSRCDLPGHPSSWSAASCCRELLSYPALDDTALIAIGGRDPNNS